MLVHAKNELTCFTMPPRECQFAAAGMPTDSGVCYGGPGLLPPAFCHGRGNFGG